MRRRGDQPLPARTADEIARQAIKDAASMLDAVANEARRCGALGADSGRTDVPDIPPHLYRPNYYASGHSDACTRIVLIHHLGAVWAHNWRRGYNERVADCKRIIATAQREPLPDVGEEGAA